MYRACRKRSQLTSKGDFRGSPKNPQERSVSALAGSAAGPAVLRPATVFPSVRQRDGGPNGWVAGDMENV